MADMKKLQDAVGALWEKYEKRRDQIGANPSQTETRELNGLLDKVEAAKAEWRLAKRQWNLAHGLPADYEHPPMRPDFGGIQSVADSRAVQTAHIFSAQGNHFESIGEQLASIYQASRPGHQVDTRLFQVNQEQRAVLGLSEAMPELGGFLLESMFSAELLQLMIQTGLLQKRCKQLTFRENTNSIKLPMIDETSRVQGARLGSVQTFLDGRRRRYHSHEAEISPDRAPLPQIGSFMLRDG